MGLVSPSGCFVELVSHYVRARRNFRRARTIRPKKKAASRKTVTGSRESFTLRIMTREETAQLAEEIKRRGLSRFSGEETDR
jgi:hypothetical protein